MTTTAPRSAPAPTERTRYLRFEQVALADLGPAPVAGRGVRGPGGRDLPVGSPLPRPVIEALARARVGAIEVVTGPAIRPADAASSTFQMRAALIRAVMWANLGTQPPEAIARDPEVGTRAVAALGLAVAASSWFPPAAELITGYGLGPQFLGPAMDRALLSAATGVRMGWDDGVVAELALSAVFSGMGLLAIPAGIGQKPTALALMERRQLERHPIVAADLLQPFRHLSPLVPQVALEQAERFDGRGYPSGLSGSAIRPEAQVVATAVRYLAATSDRPYRKAMPPHEAAEVLMSESGRLAHPSVVHAFLDAVAPYPVGSLVRLSDGRAGRILRAGTGSRPVVEVNWGPDGRVTDPVEVDLTASPTLFVSAS